MSSRKDSVRRRSHRGARLDVSSSSSESAPESLADLLFGPTEDSSEHSRHAGRETRGDQLSAQVADALMLSLATASNALLRDLIVLRVKPRRGSACLEVVLEAPTELDPRVIEPHIKRAVGWLRSEIADAIERKRVPELVVIVVPATPPEVPQ